jgi:putative glutamine amidotransferase
MAERMPQGGAAPIPRVAVSCTVNDAAGAHRKPAAFLYTSYLDALELVGLAPVAITPAHSAAALASIMSVCDGLVLTGGADIAPARYGEAPAPALGSVSLERDELEWRALDRALERDLPVFGICRGLQILNVYFGGTLYQDLPSELGATIGHEQAEPWSGRAHDVDVVADSLLHRVVRSDVIRINSFHHQGVKRLAAGLRAAAHAQDGLVEAVESPQHAWILGVQWHAERRAADVPETDHDRRLFAAFAGAVEQHAR